MTPSLNRQYWSSVKILCLWTDLNTKKSGIVIQIFDCINIQQCVRALSADKFQQILSISCISVLWTSKKILSNRVSEGNPPNSPLFQLLLNLSQARIKSLWVYFQHLLPETLWSNEVEPTEKSGRNTAVVKPQYLTSPDLPFSYNFLHSIEQLRFGGVGQSGMGSYHGKFGFDTFTHTKVSPGLDYTQLCITFCVAASDDEGLGLAGRNTGKV